MRHGLIAARNALICELMLREANDSEKRTVASELPIGWSNLLLGKTVSDTDFYAMFNASHRIVQLNILGSRLKDEFMYRDGNGGAGLDFIMDFINPDSSIAKLSIKEEDILKAKILVKEKHNIEVNLEQENLNIYDWMK